MSFIDTAAQLVGRGETSHEARHRDRRRTIIAAGAIGNVVEWYDFSLYGYLAPVLSTHFFSSANPTASLIATYGVFAAGFVMRPIGAAAFGWIGDTLGRSRALFFSYMMMVLPTVLLGVLPTYAQWGVAATGLLVVLRLFQGLSVGGAFSSSVTYLVETAAPERRGLTGSWANIGSMLGMLLGVGAPAVVATLFSEAFLNDWGWRLPYLFGGIIGITAIQLGRHLPTSKVFSEHHEGRGESNPFHFAFRNDLPATIRAIFFASGYGVMFYIPLVYLPDWLKTNAGLGYERALQINTAVTALIVLLVPLSGYISDRWVRRTHFIAAAFIATAVLGWPLYAWFGTGSYFAIIVGQVIFAILVAVPLGAAPATMAEAFKTEDRLTGYSVAYNVGLGIVGGTTPMVSTWLIHATGYVLAPAVYLVVLALISAAALIAMPDRSREPLL